MGPSRNLHQSCFPRSADSCFEIKSGVVFCPPPGYNDKRFLILTLHLEGFSCSKAKECKNDFVTDRKLVFNVLIYALLDLGVIVFTLRISILRWKILVFGGNSRITGHQNMLGNLPHCHNCPLIPAEIKSCPLEFKGK